jgi:RimJ/RimL family protein N-acetyltransferase
VATGGLSVTLRPVPVAEADRLLAGGRPESVGLQLHPDYPMAGTLDAVAMLFRAYQAMTGWRRPARQPSWWIHQVVVDGLVVGDVGFHGPPGPESPRTVEIGYDVVPGWRRQGVASRACALILQVAWADGAEVVLAETEPANVASQRVLTRNGFARRPDGLFEVTRSGP